eukprot:3820674-Amphidinium_carterae.1
MQADSEKAGGSGIELGVLLRMAFRNCLCWSPPKQLALSELLELSLGDKHTINSGGFAMGQGGEHGKAETKLFFAGIHCGGIVCSAWSPGAAFLQDHQIGANSCQSAGWFAGANSRSAVVLDTGTTTCKQS